MDIKNKKFKQIENKFQGIWVNINTHNRQISESSMKFKKTGDYPFTLTNEFHKVIP